MEIGSGTLIGDVTGRLEAVEGDLSFGAAISASASGWIVRTLVLDALPTLRKETWSVCNYGSVAFLQGRLKGREAVSWLSQGSASALDFTFSIPAPSQNHVNWTRHPSFADYGPDTVPWPYTRYEAHSTASVQFNPPGFLVADDAPFFPDYATALAKLLYGSDRAQAEQITLIRIADSGAWISHMRLSASDIKVKLSGSALAGSHIHLSGSAISPMIKAVGKHRSVRFLLPGGLPDSLYVVLARGNRWLDYRLLNWSVLATQRSSSQVSVDPPDLSTQIEQLRFRGEGETLEFKEQTPTDKDKNQMLKTIAAFANGDGGVILFGIEDGTGTIRGLSVDAARESDRLTQMIRTNVVPQPEFRVRHAQVEGKLVLALFVDTGDKPPYGIHPEKPEFYVRRAATTFRARQDEVRSLAQTESQSQSVYGIPSPLSRFRRQ